MNDYFILEIMKTIKLKNKCRWVQEKEDIAFNTLMGMKKDQESAMQVLGENLRIYKPFDSGFWESVEYIPTEIDNVAIERKIEMDFL